MVGQQMPNQQMAYSLKIPPNTDIETALKNDDRNTIGNIIYGSLLSVEQWPENYTSKITGMLIAPGAVDLAKLFSDQAYLNSKINEALSLIS